VVIVGGGVTGLAAAHRLAREGVRATLVERDSRLGGVIRTHRVEGFLVEAGPDSFLSAKPEAMDLIRRVGLEDEVIGSNDHLRATYVVRGGRLVPLPDGLMMMVPTRAWPVARSPLLGLGTKVRMAAEYFRRPRADPRPDRSVADFVRDHFGQEAVDYLAEPLLAGVYGGDPELLSAASVLPRMVALERSHGSVSRGMRAAPRGPGGGTLFRTLRGGLQRLTDRLEEVSRPEVLRAEAEAIERVPGGFRIRAGGAWIGAERVILACPAWAAAALVRTLDPELAGLLSGIRYASSMTVALGYRRGELGHPQNGFGFLVPRLERRTMVACTWVGVKFEHRVPEGCALLRCFVAGERDDGAVVADVRRELADRMGVSAEPLFAKVSRNPVAMAQYDVGHAERVAGIRGRVGLHRGLALAGNYLDGIGIPDCVRSGSAAAEGLV
jgi:oxygen-dependent protoporphyrinogen oxidase